MAVVKVPLSPYKDERGNCIKYDGPLNENIVVTFRGSNNNVTVHETAHVTKLNIDFNSNNGTFSLGGNPHRRGFSGGVRIGEDATVIIGHNVSSTAGVIISAVEGATVKIGGDVMFASQNQVRSDDGHPIFDVVSGLRVNPARNVTVGNHVWLGYGAMVLAGVEIGDGSVIGAGSIVTRTIPNNVVAAGVPASVIRTNIAWERPHLGLVAPFYKPDSSTVTKSPFWKMTTDPAVAQSQTTAGKLTRRLRRIFGK